METIVGHGRWRLKIRASASIYWVSPLESIGGVDHCSPWEVEIQNTSVVLEVETIVVHLGPWEVETGNTSKYKYLLGLSIGVLEVETIVVHGRWRFKILDSTIIHWGSPLESIGGVVLMLNVNKYIHQLLYSCR